MPSARLRSPGHPRMTVAPDVDLGPLQSGVNLGVVERVGDGEEGRKGDDGQSGNGQEVGGGPKVSEHGLSVSCPCEGVTDPSVVVATAFIAFSDVMRSMNEFVRKSKGR